MNKLYRNKQSFYFGRVPIVYLADNWFFNSSKMKGIELTNKIRYKISEFIYFLRTETKGNEQIIKNRR